MFSVTDPTALKIAITGVGGVVVALVFVTKHLIKREAEERKHRDTLTREQAAQALEIGKLKGILEEKNSHEVFLDKLADAVASNRCRMPDTPPT